MSTSFEFKLSFRHDPERVLSMLLSETFQTSQIFGSMLDIESIKRTNTDSMITHYSLNSLTMVQIWPNSLNELSAARGGISIKRAEGITAEAEAHATLAPALAGTEITIDGNVKVNVKTGAGWLEKKFVNKIESKFKNFEGKMNGCLDHQRSE